MLPSNIAFKLDGVKFALLERSRKIPDEKFSLVVNVSYSSTGALNRMWTERSNGIVVNTPRSCQSLGPASLFMCFGAMTLNSKHLPEICYFGNASNM